MPSPFVTVLICAYNVARFLPDALRSAHIQSLNDWEALILDDASEDYAEAIAHAWVKKDKRFRYVKNKKRLGYVKNLNYGLSLARGEFITVLDGDDMWRSTETLAKLTAALSSHPDVALVASGAVEIDEAGRSVRYFPNGYSTDYAIRTRLLVENIIAHNSVCYRTSDVRTLGGYDERWRYTQDYDLWLRLGLKGNFMKLPDYLACYRIHKNCAGIKKRRTQILEECRVMFVYRHAYPHLAPAVINRVLSFLATFIPKRIRHTLANIFGYHRARMRIVDFIANYI